MLTKNKNEPLKQKMTDFQSETGENRSHEVASNAVQPRLKIVLQIEWLGQTVASLSWIASVLSYGITSTGDWLQLVAASAWLLANMATIATVKAV